MECVSTDAVVIGAGVVGLAVATALARTGLETLILEATGAVGSGVSSRNSEVIHAGVYYLPGSLKARLCVEGRDRLYAYAVERNIPHRNCGKLIVATSAREADALADVEKRATANGAGLWMIDGAEARRLEPGLSPDVSAALFSPRTGIVDSHAFMVSLLGEFEDHGGVAVFETPVRGGGAVKGGVEIATGGATPALLSARVCVNAAGLCAPRVAQLLEGGAGPVARPWFAKGAYFKYLGRHPFSRLIYPTPVDGGLGVHLTFDLAGEARFGPDVEWLKTDDPDTIDFSVDPARARGFAEAVARYWPTIDPSRLAPDYAGVRPKLSGPGAPAADFLIDDASARGAPGLVHLLGIESPGLTASLAIAEAVVRLAQK